jgi:SAM-dependent methyltransferase
MSRRTAFERVPASLRSYGCAESTGRERCDLLGLTPDPAPGRVRFGDLRPTRVRSPDFGYHRGGPVDRHYIESFLEQHEADVRGRVLEVGDDSYTRRFGGERVERADVLHVDNVDGATYTGDIADGSFLPDDTFDCIILTQTLHLVYDFPAALRTIRRILRPGGVLLLTVPGISNMDSGEWGSSWYYSFTHLALRRMAEDSLAGFESEISSYGNVLAAVGFLHGLSKEELTPAELDDHHLPYSLIHALRARRPTEDADDHPSISAVEETGTLAATDRGVGP